ncbi:MAG: tRNA (N6-threonylcarbamoyladenosine(37)-N6)-methyltransferase TrmO [Deltaproteobacteria bacterium]|nr:tRNA (N6-threonylcarbamoyladenosine(37)-N6)-methyltransferase TrmO [Deltaproteobacteria bacterium]
MIIEPIGIIHAPFKKKEDCPIQSVYASGAEGRVEVFERYAPALKDIEGFSHIYLIYYFDRAGEVKLVRPPFMDDDPHGIFASRHPCRPTGIGLSIVRLKKKDGNILTVEDIDVLDKTPLLDIKPYMPKFDHVENATKGWTDEKEGRPKPEGRE